MINQELYIEILELFDLVKEEELFIEYKKLEADVLADKTIRQLINEYNFICESLKNIDYEPFVKEQELELVKLEETLNSNDKYQKYLKHYEKCNERLNEITGLVLDDIVSVGKAGCCSCK